MTEQLDFLLSDAIEPGAVKCSVCGDHRSEVTYLVPGPNNFFICDLCVGECHELGEAFLREHHADTNCRNPSAVPPGTECEREDQLEQGDPHQKIPNLPLLPSGEERPLLTRGTWPHARACRDLADDLMSIRRGADQTAVALYNYQIDLLAELLRTEHQQVESEITAAQTMALGHA